MKTESFETNAGQPGARPGWRRELVRRVDGVVQRVEPPSLVRPVADGGHHEQVTRARGGDIRQPLTFGLVAGRFLRIVQEQVHGGPSANLERTELALGIQPAAGVGARQLARQIGEDDDGKLEALCLVDGHHPDAVAALFQNRGFGRLRVLRRHAQIVDEAPERQTTAGFVLPGELGDMEHVGQRLLAGAAQHETDVAAGDVEQILNRFGDGPVVAPPMQTLQDQQGVGDRAEVTQIVAVRITGARLTKRCRQPERVKDAETLLPLEQLFVTNRRNAPRNVANTDSSSSGHSIAARAERIASTSSRSWNVSPADKHVADAARFEGADVRLRDVFAKADEAPEQQADVSRGHARPERPRCAR